MTAIGPYTQSSVKYTHNDPQIRFCRDDKKIAYDKSSIMGILSRTPIFSKFARILQIAQMDGIYDQPQANFTLLAVQNTDISDEFMETIDVGDARRIVKSSSFNRIIPSFLLEDSPVTYFMTTDEGTKLFITNLYGETMINNKIGFKNKDISASNGMIHVIDKVIIPYA